MKRLNLKKFGFTDGADKVNSDSGIFNPAGSNVKALKGADEIIGNKFINSSFGLGVFAGAGAINAGAIAAADLSAEANVKANGINNKGSIATNRGRDVVRGTATAELIAVAQTVSSAIAYANALDTGAVAATFANIDVNAIANGIKNSGELGTGKGSDSVDGDIDASIAAVATAKADAAAIVKGIAQAPFNESLTAFADAIAKSLANASIIATGINNVGGKITTARGRDKINATATSDSASFAEVSSFAFNAFTPENEALAVAVAQAIATTQDKAIAIDNRNGIIRTGKGADTIQANATGSESYGIFGGTIKMGNGNDRIEASSFGGGVNIDMGDKDDFVKGFGSATVNGGDGFDILSLDGNRDNFKIELGANSEVRFERDGIKMIANEFEQFNFANGSFSYDDLSTF
ncbi:MAG: hypothetical protein AAF915_18290 [Cyanobacteria bacterium P01_D01_bin.50]